MAISVKEVIGRVRTEITMDTDASAYRWANGQMIQYGNETIYELVRLVKHLLISVDGEPTRSDDLVATVTVEKLDTAVWALPKRYFEAVMHGIAMRCFLQDSADQANAARAQYERARFMECAGVSTVSATQG